MERASRIHSMDALRASAMLLLVPVHAEILLAVNGHGGAWATAVYWTVHLFRLPLFFAMSGFFLTLLLSRKGLRETVRNRTLRISVPLLVGLMTLVPLTVFAAQRSGAALAPASGPPVGSPFVLEPNFLWFLWYLLIIDCAALAASLLAPRLVCACGNCLRLLVAYPVAGVLVLAVPTALALWPNVEWTAAPAADSFVPEPALLAYYALFFGLGATFCAHRDLVSAVAGDAWRWVACAVVATLPAAALFSLHNSGGEASRPVVHGAGLLLYAIATWTSVIALVGLAHRYLERPHPVVRYVADSSYWIYLSHMPVAVLLVGLLGTTAFGVATQFTLIVAGSLAASLLTYALFVRYTAIGRVLNGPRKRRQRERPALFVLSPVTSAFARHRS